MRKPKGKMSLLDAAFWLLAKSKVPLHYVAMAETALRKQMATSKGATPEQTLLSAISREIAAKGRKSRFVRRGKGTYSLSARGKYMVKK